MSGKKENYEFTWKLFPSSKVHEVSDNSNSNQTPKIYNFHQRSMSFFIEHAWCKSADIITDLCLLSTE